MRVKTITHNVYKFEELSPEAKSKALAWYREGNLDYSWWENTYEDFLRICEIIGVNVAGRWGCENPKGPGSHAIYFSGFCSQGDGACFEGRYSFKKGARKAIRKYAPEDTRLHRIVDELTELQRKHQYGLAATITHVGGYYHSGSVRIDIANERFDRDIPDDAEKALKECLRDLMNWLYRQLETEHDYLQSDESCEENIVANDYEFLEDGSRCCL